MEKLDFSSLSKYSSPEEVVGIGFSGGLDSTYLLTLFLRATTFKVLVVHILTQDNETQSQHKSTKAVIDYLKENEREFEFITVEIPKEMSPKNPSWFHAIFVSYVFGQMAQYRRIDYVVAGVNREEFSDQPIGSGWDDWNLQITNAIECGAWGINYIHDKYIPTYLRWELSDMCVSRKEQISYVGGGLSKLIWFCLTPNEDNSICGVCRKCRIMLPLLK